MMLGGRVAEKLVLDDISSGAEHDLQQATGLARRMISRWGMGEKLGPVAFHRDEDQVFLGRELGHPRDFSEKTAQLIDEEVRRLMSGLEETAIHHLQAHRPELERMASALLERETLDGAEVQAILDHRPGDGGGPPVGREERAGEVVAVH